jgi:hypothetical protein
MAVAEHGVATRTADGVAMPGIAINLFPAIAIDRLIADQRDGTVGYQLRDYKSSDQLGRVDR